MERQGAVMPTFIFTSPEGKEYEVEGPEGATQEQAWQQLQRQLGTQPQAPATPPLAQVGRGSLREFAGYLSSLQDLTPDPTRFLFPKRVGEAIERTRKPTREFAQAPSESGYETAGHVLGMLTGSQLLPGLGLAGGGARIASAIGRAPTAIDAFLANISPTLGRLAGIHGAKVSLSPRGVQAAETAARKLGSLSTGLGNVAEQAAKGAIGGALEPTASGTPESHLRSAELGALTAAGMRTLGYAAPVAARIAEVVAKHGTTLGILQALHMAGVPLAHGLWFVSKIRNNPLSRFAGTVAGIPARTTGAVASRAPGFLSGAAVGGGNGEGQAQDEAPGPSGGAGGRPAGSGSDQQGDPAGVAHGATGNPRARGDDGGADRQRDRGGDPVSRYYRNLTEEGR